MFKKLYDNVTGFFSDLKKKGLVVQILAKLYFGFSDLYKRALEWTNVKPAEPITPPALPDNPEVPTEPEELHWWQLWKRFKNKK